MNTPSYDARSKSEVLQRLQILDIQKEQVLHDVSLLAASASGTSIAFIGIWDDGRLFLKGRQGIEPCQLHLEDVDILAWAVSQAEEVVVEDTNLHQSFASAPLVTGKMGVRFYAGVPVHAEGVAVGTLCVLGTEPKTVTTDLLRCLQALGRQVERHLEFCLLELLLRDRKAALRKALAQAETVAAESAMTSRRFQTLFQGLPVGCSVLDIEGHVIEWNAANEEIFGYTAEEIVAREIFEVLPPESRVEARKSYADLIRSGGRRASVERQIVRRDGSLVSILSSSVPLYGSAGELIGVIGTSVDISCRKEVEQQLLETSHVIEAQKAALAEANQRLANLATTDQLTTLHNRRSFDEFLERQIMIAKSAQLGLSLILLDVDDFKSYNDAHGHLEGDLVLAGVGAILKATVLEGHFAARYGGEEFVVVLPGTDLLTAAKIATRIRRAIEAAKWPKRRITASFGVADFGSDSIDMATLLETADQRLYAAKAAGRNIVIASGPSGIDLDASRSIEAQDHQDLHAAIPNARHRHPATSG